MKAMPPEASAFDHWCEEKLRNIDTDQFRHVNNAVISSFFEAGRMEVFTGRRIAALLSQAQPVVARLLLNFHRELFYPGVVRIGTRVVQVGQHSVQLVQGVFDDQGCVASAEATCVFVDPQKHRAINIHDDLRKALLLDKELA